jgi:Ala-tRNA(Pro) deacylase
LGLVRITPIRPKTFGRPPMSPQDLSPRDLSLQDPSSQDRSPQDLFAYLDTLGIAHRTLSHPPVFTVEQSKALRGRIDGAHTKNLFLRDKKNNVYLVVALESTQIELKGLHRVLGANGRFSFGSADLLKELLGVVPGSVTPFAVINDTQGRVTVILDAAMMEYDVLNYHPLQNTMTTTISRADLLKFLEAAGHPARIERISGAPEPAGD